MRKAFLRGFLVGAGFGLVLSVLGLWHGALQQHEAWKVGIGFTGFTLFLGLACGAIQALLKLVGISD
jgi:hypothetical protein